ncbi:hypothetical protein [Acetobacter nitrogenifigens]|nr:hypothetical protein [Acetobacter nitrogenifigens]
MRALREPPLSANGGQSRRFLTGGFTNREGMVGERVDFPFDVLWSE